MNNIMHAAAALLLLAATGASAQAVYRCGNSYSDQGCPGAERVSAQDGRTAAQAAQASAAAQRDARLADTLEARRKEQERGAATKPIIIGSAKPPAREAKAVKSVHFKAQAPGPAGAKTAKTQAKKKKPSA